MLRLKQESGATLSWNDSEVKYKLGQQKSVKKSATNPYCKRVYQSTAS